jgi:hypothetical protein
MSRSIDGGIGNGWRALCGLVRSRRKSWSRAYTLTTGTRLASGTYYIMRMTEGDMLLIASDRVD